MWKEHSYSTDSCALLWNILVLMHTICRIPGCLGQLSTDLVDKSIQVDNSQIVTHHFAKSVPIPMLHSHMSLICLADRCHHYLGCQFNHFQTLHIYLIAALLLCHHHSLCQVVLNFYGGAHFTCESWNTLQTSVGGWSCYCHCHGTPLFFWIPSDWVTLVLSVAWYPHHKCCCLPQHKMLH